MNLNPMTEKQRGLLAFCAEFLAANDQFPTSKVIAEHFGWSSQNSAVEMMAALADRGYITRNAVGKWRLTAMGKRVTTLMLAHT